MTHQAISQENLRCVVTIELGLPEEFSGEWIGLVYRIRLYVHDLMVMSVADQSLGVVRQMVQDAVMREVDKSIVMLDEGPIGR